MKPEFPSSIWTRRRLLQSASALAATALLPRGAQALALPQVAGSALPNAAPAAASATTAAKPFSQFTDVAHAAGLTQKMIYGTPDGVTYIVEEMGGGVVFFDYDNDGYMDIFVLGGRTLNEIPADASNRLYKNNRDGTFTDVTKKAGLWDAGWAVGACVGDYNNDGFEDLFLTYYGQNKLYRNNGDGTFTDVTKEAGLLHEGNRFGAGCTFLDYNRDGHLDLFVSNYVEFDMAHALKPSLEVPNCNYAGVPVACGPRGLKFPQHCLYRNNGDGTFTDVSTESGIAAIRGSYGLTAVAFDVDEDGWTDIFVACDTSSSLLLLNNHDGTFREEGLMRGVAISPDGLDMAGMGLGLGDYDVDGHLDMLKTHFQVQPSGLYHNLGTGDFEDQALAAGIANERTYVSWGAGIVDLDNDGYPDIFWVTGNIYAELERTNPQFPYKGPRVLFRNRGNGTFERLTEHVGPAIQARHVSRGCAFGDFDNDGDLDILIMNQHEPPSLLRNDAPTGNHWIKIRLEGVKSNRSAIGARVLAHYGGKTQAQSLTSQCSYVSVNDPRLHFGLGGETRVDIEIYWPNGLHEKFAGLSVDRLLTFREGQGIVPGRPFVATPRVG